jgi:hypothetical protein
MSSSATIKLFLPSGDARRLRVGEISNWTGKALAATREELGELLQREEAAQSGVYFLFGMDAESGQPRAYIGEAEIIRDRLRTHRNSRDWWETIVVFVSKDENLTKAHVRYLESQLIQEALTAGRYQLDNVQEGKPRLPESDREDMEVFLVRIRQMLPVLGSDLLVPVHVSSPIQKSRVDKPSRPKTAGKAKTQSPRKSSQAQEFTYRVGNALAHGRMSPSGFIVLKGSTAAEMNRPSCVPVIAAQRAKLRKDGTLILRKLEDGSKVLEFSRDAEFKSPSGAAAIVCGGSANGRICWKDARGRTLEEIENGS